MTLRSKEEEERETNLGFEFWIERMATKSGLSQKEADIQMMLAADVHLGTKNCDFQMERYVFKRRTDGNNNKSLFFSYFERKM